MRRQRILVGGERVDGIAGDDRGLAYGDGVFETILVHEERPVWWEAHWHRLVLGAKLLDIPVPDEAFMREQANELVAGEGRAVLKLLLSRGGGGRGYLSPVNPQPTVVLGLHEAADPVAGPVVLRWCETRLALQPTLAGFKHLNRLENVLARGEWRDPAIFEGVMLDTEGRVVCATAANIFARIDGRWLTPRVDRCGIAGLVRGWLLQHQDDAEEEDIGPEDLRGAESLFLCNALRGILPVRSLDGWQWSPAPANALRRRLVEAEPAYAGAYVEG